VNNKTKTVKNLLFIISIFSILIFASCERQLMENDTALQEQSRVEQNQTNLNAKQPSPMVSWSLERDNLIKRFKLQNDRSVVFYMYLFNYGVAEPIGYYQVNKVSSVNSQLTNPSQIVSIDATGYDSPGIDELSHHVLDSPQEDGSYGTNGDAVFGFTPDDVYIEHNMQYVCSTVPLSFKVQKLVNISVESSEELKELMNKINQ